jgi:hypothetical protein
MTTANAPRLSTSETQSPEPAYSECGAGGERQLTVKFGPSSVVLAINVGRTLEVHNETWEYCFTADDPLELRFVSAETLVGTARLLGSTSTTTLTGLDGALHFSCTRPASEDSDQQYELVFARVTTTGSTARPVDRPGPPPHAPGKPEMPTDIDHSAAQPTLIIRTKRSCPTGAIKPTITA